MTGFACRDCRVDTSEIGEYYMVRDDIWRSVVEHKIFARQHCDDGGVMLCIGCLEKRLEFNLRPAHFTDAPINWVGFGFKSKRLLERLGACPGCCS